MLNERIELPADGTPRWAGMGNYLLISPDGQHEVALPYVGEPPHGDSFHELNVDGTKLPGFAWGRRFAFTSDSRYLAASWMAKRYERRTIIIDVDRRRFVVLPTYIHDFAFQGLTLEGMGADQGLRFDLGGTEAWTSF
jgi:hypothetical protein